MARKSKKKDPLHPDRWHELYSTAIIRPGATSVFAPQALGYEMAEDEYKIEDDRRWWHALFQKRSTRVFDRAEQALRSFTPGERLLLYALSAALGLSALFMVASVNALATVTVPASGGTLVEGEVGSARFLNPLLTISTPDQDITALVYSGLMRQRTDGTLVPDLAAAYDVSGDGRTYTFTLRPAAIFHDDTPVTSADVVYTIRQAQNPAIDSDRRADWAGVVVSAPDERTVVFTLPRAYAPFIHNTTLGILPQHLWQNVPDEEFAFSPLNTHPVGSGPFKIENVTTNSTGAAEQYELVPFKSYALGAPYLRRITFVFFPNAEALVEGLNRGDIDAAAGLSPQNLSAVTRDDISAASVTLPRVFGVFFNQSHSAVLADVSVREALDAAIDKEQIVSSVLAGRGSVLHGPIPPGLLDASDPAHPKKFDDIAAPAAGAQETRLAAARSILEKGGWTQSATNPPAGGWKKGDKTLSFTVVTADQPELVATARAIVADWQALGIDVQLQIYPISELNTTVIRPRNYDALLFGEVVGPELDLYAFWHSSQRNDPGLNLALYANARTDALLSEARATADENRRRTLYTQFEALLVEDTPAIFLYAPDFLYIVPDDLSGVKLGALRSGAERFENAYEWYMRTEDVWTIFAPSTNLTTN